MNNQHVGPAAIGLLVLLIAAAVAAVLSGPHQRGDTGSGDRPPHTNTPPEGTPTVILKREPALWSALAATVIQLLSAFFIPLSVDQQGVLNAVVVATLGLATAIAVKSDGISAAALGLLKALIALGLAFGLALDPTQQAVIMSFAVAVSGMFVRTQETAPVAAVTREPHVI